MGFGKKLKNALLLEHHPPNGGWKEKSLPGSFPNESAARIEPRSQSQYKGTEAAEVSTIADDDTPILSPELAGTDRKGVTFDDKLPDTSTAGTEKAAGKHSSYRPDTTTTLEEPSDLESEADAAYYDGNRDTFGIHDTRKQGRLVKHRHQDSGVDMGLIDRSASTTRRAAKDPYQRATELSTGNYHNWDAPDDASIGENAAHTGQYVDEGVIDRRGMSGMAHSGQAVGGGGGVYNTVTGHGSQQEDSIPAAGGAYSSPRAAANGTGGTWTSPSAGQTTDTTWHPRNATRDIAPSSRDDHAGLGFAGAGVGAGAGAAAAALAHKHHQEDNREIYGDQTAAGVPHSSMLDPYSLGRASSTSTNNTTHKSGTHARNGVSTAGGWESNGNAFSHNATAGKAANNSASPTSGSSTPPGGHYGPGHEGAKVMHQCHNCGVDNDITRYFKRDVVYRIS